MIRSKQPELMPPMEIPAKRWYKVIEKRRSRRRFNSEPLKAEHIKRLKQVCNDFRPFPCARAVLINKPPDKILKGAVGAYGKIRGAPAFMVFIGDERDPLLQEQLGYFGEGIILEAEAMQLNTCWVGGSFRQKAARTAVDVDDDEVILAIVPIGIAPAHPSFEERILSAFGLTHRRKHLSELTIGLKEREWPEWMKAALNAARLAPSALNRQPWRFHVEPNSIAVATNGGEIERDSVMSKRLDCGIAMLHIEVAALAHNVKGYWEFNDPPLVARFIVES